MFSDSDLLIGKAMGVRFEREKPTENYVECPPAAIVTNNDGTTFTLGTQYLGDGFNLEFNVLANDVDTQEFAQRIVYKGGQVRIFGKAGWRTWNGRAFI